MALRNRRTTAAEHEEDEPEESAGLIDLDMGQFASGTLQDPLRHAVGLRTAQDEQNMRMWNSWPSLFQNTIFHGEQDPEIKTLRHEGTLPERIARASALKEQGNDLLKAGKIEKAIESYEKGAGVLRFVECFRPDWKNDDGSYKGIEDRWLRVDEGAMKGDAEEAHEAQRLVTSCYLNIALSAHKQQKWDVMFGACTEVLEKVDGSSAKALFRRAQARVAPMTAKDAEKDAAIEDLAKAARLEPQDKAVRELLSKMKSEKQAQRKADRDRFGGLFDRGQVTEQLGVEETERTDPASLDLNDPKVQAMLDVRPGPQTMRGAQNGAGAKKKAANQSPRSDVGLADEDEDDRGGGLINLDMKQFGKGTMEDPLKHAVALRSAQDDKKMRMWKSWPSLFQNTIFHGEKDADIKALRRAGSLSERMSRATALKEEGNALLKTGDLEKAIEKYEQGAGIFRFVECVRPDWRNDDGSYKGIEDQWLRVDEEALRGDTEEPQEARKLVASCYLNIALAAQKQERWEVMIEACTEVLEKVDDSNTKALFRRAQARVAPMTALDTDQDAAIADLTDAARLAPQDKAIRELLAKLKAERQAQRKADRSQFAGLFDRGNVVTNDPRTEGEQPDPSKLDLRDPKVQAMLDIYPGPSLYEDQG
mmetsp:Transcript_110150/g.310579  ORF Transcript_110150/g.310579 Transcript_110150/m.310579 type:complete len:649 (-) Transcript_110150:91-2037(-)